MINQVDDMVPAMDIITFINNARTGREPPPRLEFVPYTGLNAPTNSGARSIRSRNPGGTASIYSNNVFHSGTVGPSANLKDEAESFVSGADLLKKRTSLQKTTLTGSMPNVDMLGVASHSHKTSKADDNFQRLAAEANRNASLGSDPTLPQGNLSCSYILNIYVSLSV
jgi:hypothetical protein